ncbi:MAG: PAS domain S-box protein [Dissulfurispiraceae bacterium]
MTHIVITIVLASCIFILDILKEVGIATYFLYLFPLFYAFLYLKRQHLITLAAVVSMLTVSSLFLSPAGGNIPRAIVNRIIGVIIFWSASFIFIRLQKAEQRIKTAESELRKSNEELEQRVENRTKELQEGERRYRQLVVQNKLILESAGEGIFGLDIKGKHTFVNPAAAKMLGYEEEELIGSHSHSTWHHTKTDGTPYPEDECPIYSASKDGAVHHIRDEVFWKKDNTSFNVDYTSTPIIDNDKIVGAVVTFRDITEQKLMEASILQAKQEWERTFNSVPDMIAVIDKEYRIVRVNRAMAQRLGMSAEQCIGQGCYHCMHGTDHPPSFCPHTLMLADCQMHQAEVHDDRLGADFLITAVPLFDGHNQLSGSVHVARDITERKQAVEALRVAEKTFRDLLETIQLIAVMLDRKGNITFCNDYLLDLTGWKRKEVLGRNWFELFIPLKEREQIRKVFASIINGEKNLLHYENTITAQNGRELLISWNNTLLHDLEGRIAGTASIGIDITEHRSLEAQLLQAQKMEAVGILAGGIAHDFNNILTAIMGYGHLVRYELSDNDPLVTNVDQILQSAERGAQLTRGLLAFSRKQVLNPKPVEVNNIIRKFETLVSRLIGEHIEVRILLANTEMIINADSVQIEQVLMNMATNARDAMPNGGYFTISTQLVQPDEDLVREHPNADLGTYALISVSDTGVGMTKESLENIFDPFFTTKELGRGTGLGLAMVYGIIDQHHGHINVISEPAKGTTFNIYLPIYKPEMEASVTDTAISNVVGGSETILIAEDDDNLRELADIVLKQYGYQVILAENGEDAITKFITHKDEIKLVILDMIMPKKSGKEAYDAIKKVRPGIKTIFSSGYTADKIAADEMHDERLDLIMKPWSPKRLLMKVREVLDS